MAKKTKEVFEKFEQKNATVKPVESKVLNDKQKQHVAMLEQAVRIAVDSRNQYLNGIMDGMELDNKWVFDLRSMAFIKKG